MTKAKRNNQTARTKNSETKNLVSARRETELGSLLPAPGNLVRRFRNEMDRLLQDFGFDNLTDSFANNASSLGLGVWQPEVEVFERDGQIVVRADLPGLKKEDIKIDLTDSAITIDGERKQEHEERDRGYYRSERSYGRFYRRIPLPDGADSETAEAQFRNGVLELTFALHEPETKTRKLEIIDGSASSKAKAAGR